ncbi:amino acid adenylation domain-containing protein [Streptomyces sp. NPDC102395]|uniref:non-ribosomal peptide synthetase family protein n=1 Tax=Streptomyces sp. NPDC102395 TaxID=3366168 RepID=UPI003820539E
MTRPTPDLERLRRLSPAKYALLLRALREREAPAPAATDRPLSFAQERLWFLDQLTPGSPVYNMPYAIRLTGALDVPAVGRAFGAVTRRHETLRTSFPAVDGRPRQVVTAPADLDVPVTDLRGLPDAERDTEAARLAAEHATAPFDLATGPLLRVALLRLGDEEWVALLNLHHIVGDDWSIGILVREFSLAYGSFTTGGGDPLPPLRAQYGDHARRQRERYGQEGALTRELDHWSDVLAGELPSLELPTDRPRPPVQTHSGAVLTRVLPADRTDRLRALARQEGATLFMTLLAAYGVLLRRYSGRPDLVVGTTSASRHRPETEPLIGFLVNTLPLRLRVDGDTPFRTLLAEVRRRVLDAFAHQDVPFERIVEKVQPDRDLSRAPLFQTMLNLHNARTEDAELPGLRLSRYGADRPASAMFDLSLDVSEADDGGLRCDWEYNTDLFDAATIDRLSRHYERVLAAVTADADQAVADIPLLSDSERHALLTEANEISVAVEPEDCVHRLFEEHARLTPDAVAVVDGDRRTTYGELDRGAELVARRLRAMGVGPEVRVGLCGPRSADTVAALLGVLKAGGAYVPLDPTNPVDRLNFVIADAEVRVLLVNRAIAEAVPGLGADVPVGLFDEWLAAGEEGLPAAAGGDEPPAPVASNLAFIVYTSGSTGRAKGGMITHGALVSAFRSWERVYELGTVVKRHLQAANLAFDVFTGDLVRALCSGGSLVLCSREVLLDPAKLYGLLQRERVDFADLVPVVVRLLSGHVAEQGRLLDNFKVLAVGADIWFMKDYWALHALCPPGTRLVNSYGITESTVDSGLFETPMPGRGLEEPVPIGRPLPNTEFYVLDDRLRPVPTGVNGTLYIGGLALARGYVGRPGLTAERFLPHPFAKEPGARIYNTGDLARVLPGGDVEVLGRVDRQIKIRGFRIELEEIEAVLGKHPDVQDAAVVVRLDERGDKRLAGYAVPRPGRTADPADLVEHLRRQLPYYMVPTTLTVLERMPLNSNGKHDRKALPAPAEADGAAARTGTALVDPVERRIAEVWRDVLGVEEVTAEDDFFDLGGHSLLIPRIAFELRRRFDAEIPLVELFEATTVGAQARLVAGAGLRTAAADDAPALVAVLDPAVAVADGAARTPAHPPRKILLTGATGFLGIHLLDALLHETDAVVHCLVRDDSEQAALARLRRTADEHAVELRHENRIAIVRGDLGSPLLGLSEDDFDALADGLDAIHHSGARVNFVLPYQALAAVNVRGTEEILRLAARAGGAHVHHVSTAAVPVAAAGPDEPTAATLQGGYNQSKWVAERLAVQARERGVPVTVHRPDYVAGHSVSGRGNPKDLIWAMIKGSVQLGSCPDVTLPVHMVPVDLVVRAMVSASLTEDGGAGRAYDLAHPRPVVLRELFGWVRDFGYDLRLLPYAQWLAELVESTRRSADNALHPFVGALRGAMDQDPGDAPRTPPAQNAYEATAVACPPVDEALVRAYLAHLVHSGFLPAPTRGGQRNEENE